MASRVSSQAWRSAVVIFRRDLRLHDNRALSLAAERLRASSGTLHPVFIFDPRQCSPEQNAVFNANSVRFMVDSLNDLATECQETQSSSSALTFFYGEAHEVVDRLLQSMPNLDAVVVNADVTPFSKQRDEAIQKVCDSHGAAFVGVEGDGLLHIPDTIRTSTSDSVYKVFTPFFKNCSALPLDAPVVSWPPPSNVKVARLAKQDKLTEWESAEELYTTSGMPSAAPHFSSSGGRTVGLTLLERAVRMTKYGTLRDDVTKDDKDPGTTHLGPHLKFGTLGIRETAHRIRSIGDMLRELYWREFYQHLTYNFPTTLQGQISEKPNANFKEQYDGIWWSDDKEALRRFETGTTGVPIVDAGIREMLETGHMHNRLRMIVACFLTKDLHIHWREGEKFFAKHLTDYDPGSNNGGWQWAASTGADSQPYFRIFRPSSQQEKWDKASVYVKRWIPELRKVSSDAILQWYEEPVTSKRKLGADYPVPMVNHTVEAAKTKELFEVGLSASKATKTATASASVSSAKPKASKASKAATAPASRAKPKASKASTATAASASSMKTTKRAASAKSEISKEEPPLKRGRT